ncbi:shikimate dehydrogenase [Sideroxydans sp.]
MTDRYAVIGNPISHSKSPLIHRMFAEQTGQDISYEAIEAPLDGFAATVERLRKEGYKGCNVTVPFKLEAYQLATVAELPATTAQAANTMLMKKNGDLVATNTDGIGLVRDIRNNLGFSLEGKRVLLMGAGGASRGVLFPLIYQVNSGMTQQSPEITVIANRTPAKAQQIINDRDFQLIAAETVTKARVTRLQACGYDELATQQFDLIINATSAGLTDSTIPLPNTIFAPNALAYDMMYGRETPFMKFARDHGAQVADGLGMLVEQAAEAFFIWRGVRPDTSPVLEALRK